jgi:hypothetical protein
LENESILSAIDAEIARLEEAKRLLGGARSLGRKKGRTTKLRRRLSAEARARIAAAQKKRWAAVKKSAK